LGTDEEEFERLTRSLRSELFDLDLDVEPATTDSVPKDARAAEALVLGAFVVRLARTSETLSSLVRTVRAWLGDHRDRRIRIELDGDVLELSGASDAERERLVNAWIERHGTA
jgi:hypothetical protein